MPKFVFQKKRRKKIDEQQENTDDLQNSKGPVSFETGPFTLRVNKSKLPIQKLAVDHFFYRVHAVACSDTYEVDSVAPASYIVRDGVAA